MYAPIPDERRVEAAADAVLKFLRRQPNVVLPSHRMACQIARLILRTDYWLAPRNTAPSSTRWCHSCGTQTETVYRDVAERCMVCDAATVQLREQVLELPSVAA